MHTQLCLKTNYKSSLICFKKTKRFWKNEKKIESFRYLIKITNMIEINLTLIKTKRFVQLNSKWFLRNEIQIRKKINKIEQIKKIYTYFFKCKKFKTKKIIQKRQSRQKLFVKKFLKIKNINHTDNVIRKIENEINYVDNNVIEKKSIQSVSKIWKFAFSDLWHE